MSTSEKYPDISVPQYPITYSEDDDAGWGGCDRFEPACKEMSAGRRGASMALGSCTVGKCEQVGGRHNETCRYLLAAYLPNRKLIAASQMGK